MFVWFFPKHLKEWILSLSTLSSTKRGFLPRKAKRWERVCSIWGGECGGGSNHSACILGWSSDTKQVNEIYIPWSSWWTEIQFVCFCSLDVHTLKSLLLVCLRAVSKQCNNLSQLLAFSKLLHFAQSWQEAHVLEQNSTFKHCSVCPILNNGSANGDWGILWSLKNYSLIYFQCKGFHAVDWLNKSQGSDFSASVRRNSETTFLSFEFTVLWGSSNPKGKYSE